MFRDLCVRGRLVAAGGTGHLGRWPGGQCRRRQRRRARGHRDGGLRRAATSGPGALQPVRLRGPDRAHAHLQGSADPGRQGAGRRVAAGRRTASRRAGGGGAVRRGRPLRRLADDPFDVRRELVARLPGYARVSDDPRHALAQHPASGPGGGVGHVGGWQDLHPDLPQGPQVVGRRTVQQRRRAVLVGGLHPQRGGHPDHPQVLGAAGAGDGGEQGR